MAKLTDLPNELIDEIVALVYAANPKQYLGAVHRVFLPFSRNLTFKTLEITTFARLACFCAVVKGASPVAKLLLSPTGSGVPLPSLVMLKLKDSFVGWSNPFALSHYANLSRYPELGYLELEVDRVHSSLGRYPPTAWSSPLFIDGLDLCGHLNGNPAVLEFLSACPFLRHVYFLDENTDSVNNLSPLLAAIANPSEVEYLSVGAVADAEEDLSAALERFVNLAEITFHLGSFTSAVLLVLLTLPHLHTLGFTAHCGVSTFDLLALVGPQRPPRLRALKVCTVWENDDSTSFDSDDDDEDSPGQYGWSDTSTRAGLRKVIEAAAEANIELSGLAIEQVEGDMKREAAEARRDAEAAAARE
ncbi:hypothetical protein JCM8097_002753 [Rhodosporidiobolus ruineniae]